MQVKLLRVIQEKTIRPLGHSHPEIPVDVGSDATHKELGELVAEGSFREDLYYRINVIGLHVPTLHERGDDVLMLAHHTLVRLASAQEHADAASNAASAGRALELRIPRATCASSKTLSARSRCARRKSTSKTCSCRDLGRDRRGTEVGHGAPLGTQLEEIERDAIVKALEHTRYNKTAAAKRLGITFRALRYRIKLGIE